MNDKIVAGYFCVWALIGIYAQLGDDTAKGGIFNFFFYGIFCGAIFGLVFGVGGAILIELAKRAFNIFVG